MSKHDVRPAGPFSPPPATFLNKFLKGVVFTVINLPDYGVVKPNLRNLALLKMLDLCKPVHHYPEMIV